MALYASLAHVAVSPAVINSACGEFTIVKATSLVAVATYRHDPAHALGRAEPGRFPMTLLCFTTAGRWLYCGNDGVVTLDSSVVLAGNRNRTYACEHVPGMADENVILALKPGAVASDRVHFPRELLRSRELIARLPRVLRAMGDDVALETAVFDAFELAGLRGDDGAPLDLRMERAKRYVEERFTEKLTLDEMAGTVSLSPYRFAHRFRRHVGISPHQYVLDLRVERAKRLLREVPEKPIASIALELGFNDGAHFTRSFKRRTGLMPHMVRASGLLGGDRDCGSA